jgi:poly(3-hydroxyalkanoate) synthetase
VCALDNERAGTVGALTSREAAAAAVAESARRGYPDGQALAGVFAWLLPNDLVWNYVGKNRRRSTSSTGTRTPSASRPGCTATSCAWRSTTR